MWRTTLFTVSLFASAAAFSGARGQTAANDERYIKPLIEVDFGNIYNQDGAADGTITMKGDLIGSGPNLKPHAAVKAIVDLKASAIPLLIRHLDDPRLTQTYFNRKQPVPVGHLTLDILLNVLKPNSVWVISHCGDDGLGACIQPGYYFRPDASLQTMAAVKAKWRNAYHKGLLQFQYPSWWR